MTHNKLLFPKITSTKEKLILAHVLMVLSKNIQIDFGFEGMDGLHNDHGFV